MDRNYKTSFVYSFKRGDNLIYSVNSLNSLVKAKLLLDEKEQNFMNKSIIVLCASIIELCLCEIFHRARHHTREGVPTLSQKQIRGLQKTSKDEFELYIRMCRQNVILKKDRKIYDRIEEIRKCRNRIHIQNLYKDKPDDERDIFTDRNADRALKSVEWVLDYVSKNYPRKHKYTDDVVVEW